MIEDQNLLDFFYPINNSSAVTIHMREAVNSTISIGSNQTSFVDDEILEVESI